MADITKCSNQSCQWRRGCYRATAPDSKWQSYSLFQPSALGCEYFLSPARERKWYDASYEKHSDVREILDAAPGHVCNRIDRVIDQLLAGPHPEPEEALTVEALEDARALLVQFRKCLLDMADLVVEGEKTRTTAAPEVILRKRAKKEKKAKDILATVPPEHPLAPDEVRLAAGWTQQTVEDVDDGWESIWEPIEGPPGDWRLHSSGTWVRWVREKEDPAPEKDVAQEAQGSDDA